MYIIEKGRHNFRIGNPNKEEGGTGILGLC